MRTEKEIYNKIINIAKSNDLVKAVFINGSRVNPKVEKDILRDYDIVYVVDEIKSFIEDINWLKDFGEIAIIQDPNANDIALVNIELDIINQYNWLILFKDHSRIDISIITKELAMKEVINDSLTVILLDKDNILPDIAKSSDKDYHIKNPTKEQYNACVNNFWWCLQNVTKGLGRNQIPYAMKMYNVVVKDMLDNMVDWYIGSNYNFSVSVGKWGKYYSKLLDPDIYLLYEKTYSNCAIENIWESIDNACILFNRIAIELANCLSYSYNYSEESSILEYMNFVRKTNDIIEVT